MAVLSVVLLAPGLVGCQRSVPARDPRDAAVRAETFDLYWAQLNREFPFFERAGVDWRASRERYRPQAIGAGSVAEFYRVLAEMLAELRDPHIGLDLAGVPGVERATGEAGSVDLSIVRIGDGYFVRRWPEADGVNGERGGGFAELLEIDGRPPHNNLNSLLLWGEEGSTVPLAVRWGDGAKQEVGLVRRVGGMRFEPGQSPPVVTSDPPVVVRPSLMADTPIEYAGTQVGEVTIRFGESGTMTTQWRGDRRSDDHVQVSREEAARSAKVRNDWIAGARMGKIGYLRISSFADRKDRPGAEMQERISAMLGALHDTEGLILDLRYNGGGDGKVMIHTAERLARRATDTLVTPEHLLWIFPIDYVVAVRPTPDAYKGRVVVLMNRWSASAAEHLALTLKDCADAVLIGEQTMGAEAGVKNVQGPDGSVLSFGSRRYLDAKGFSLQNTGVTPDRPVEMTVERVREIGFAAAVKENERAQFDAACRELGVEPEGALGEAEMVEAAEGIKHP